MKRDRSDSGDKQKPRAAAGRRATRPDAAKGGDAGDKKKAAPRAAKPPSPKPPAVKPAAKPAPASRAKKATPAARTAPARPQKASATAKAAKAETPAAAGKPLRKAAPAKPPAAPRAARPARAPRPPAPAPRKPEADVSDEERIESAKYETGERPPRVFEEERFIFPETYGHNRLRLLVKDPQWLFAHWDVDPGVFSGLRGEMGERAAALARLTLKVEDPENGGGAVIHLPEDARSWYLRADRVRRAYRAELGLTLPSGEYRLLATSNTVRTPAGSPSPRRASRRARYEGPRRPMPLEPAGDWPKGEAMVPPAAAPVTERGKRAGAAPGPWQPKLVEPRPGQTHADDAHGDRPEKGGASDVHGPRKPGASDLHRR